MNPVHLDLRMEGMEKGRMRFLRLSGFALLSCLLAGCQSAGFTLLNSLAPDVTRVRGIVFAPGERGRMDLYAPRADRTASPGKAPLIVFWYGGSWQWGSQETTASSARRWPRTGPSRCWVGTRPARTSRPCWHCSRST
jgi:acetyl esterase/lipase